MKKMKKFMALLMAVIMMMAMSVTVMADDSGKITINNAITDQEYSVYKVFDLESVQGNNYSYKVVEAWKNFFATSTNFGTGFSTNFYDTYFKNKINSDGYLDGFDGTDMPDGDKVALAKAMLSYAETNDISATKGPKRAAGDTVEFTGLANGYYLVDSGMGALCSLNTLNNEATIEEKNTKPTLGKVIDDGSENGLESTTANIGDTVAFDLKVTVGAGVDNDYVITDTLPAGMTYEANSVKITGWTLDTDYTVVYNNNAEPNVLTITLKETKLKNIDTTATIVISYNATLDTDAVVAGNGNINTAILADGTYATTQVEAVVYTYSFDLVKTDSSNKVISAAEFVLYDAATSGNRIYVVTDGDNYKVTGGPNDTKISAGKVTISGLKNGTYYLEETTAPAGYNKLEGRTAVTISSANNSATVNDNVYASGGVRIINQTGTVLPTTGGIGTTMFYIIGGILVVGAAVILITRKRMENE